MRAKKALAPPQPVLHLDLDVPDFDELMYSPPRHEDDEELAVVLLEFVGDSVTLEETVVGLREDDRK